MTLREKIKKDLVAAMKAKDEARKETTRVILGELSRCDQKDPTDDQVIKILKKLIKSERELLEKTGAENDSAFITIVEGYLPQMATEDEIAAWIRENIDFSAYKNKMQAMGPIMKHFGATADGNAVKAILLKL